MPGLRPAIASGPGETGAGQAVSLGAALALLGLLLGLTLVTSGARPLDGAGVPSNSAARNTAASTYAKLPVSFIPNRGQINGDARYYAQGEGFGLYFAKNRALISLSNGKRGHVLGLTFLGANPHPRIEGARRARGRVNYLTGNVHHTNIPTYKELAYRELWPGIDMVFKGGGGKLTYEFLVAPGADPSKIRLAWQGASGLSITASDELSIKTPLGPLTDARPRTYQVIDGRRLPVKSAFALTGESSKSYGFSLGHYDRRRPLLIDPSLAYSTYLPGTTASYNPDIVVDAQGNAYLTGGTYGQGSFPTTPGAFNTAGHNGGRDAFVTKLSSDGSSLVYSTFLGGADHDEGYGIAVDASGRAYVTGYTYSSDFPTTLGAYKPSATVGFGLVQEAFVTRLSADGSSLSYSTYLGGSNSERGRALAVGGDGSAYITGETYSNDFPTTLGAYDTSSNGAFDLFVTKLNATGSLLTYSTYLGGSSDESLPAGIAVDGSGSAYLTGSTQSSNFPTTPGAYYTTPGALSSTYITKLSPDGSTLAYSTFLPGAGTSGIAVDAAGGAYVAGSASSASFPTTPGAYDTTPNGSDGDAFVTKLSLDGSSLAYSTLIGGFAIDYANGLALDGSNNAYIAGYTTSTDYPTTAGAHDTNNGTASCNAFLADAFVTKLNATATALSYSSYLGGCGAENVDAVAVGSDQSVYVTGTTDSPDYPVTGGAYNTTPPVQVLDPRFGYYYVSRTFITKLFTSGSELSTAGLIVRKDARPDTPKDFSFNAGGGLSPASFMLDDDPTDPTLAYFRHFHPVAAGSGYSISEIDPVDWKLTSAVCSDASPISNIALSPGETVSCTFVNESKGYARPKSATPQTTRLVPAFQECTSANGNHGAPLALPSCDPARPSSSYLTFAAPDRNTPYKGPATGSGLLNLRVECSDGGTPPCASSGDQEDVGITATLEGVRCVGATGGCSSAGANYEGKVLFSIPLRLTDTLNGPDANWPGTAADTVLSFGVACTAGSCNLDSSVDAVTPIVPEQKRVIWELGQVRVLDGGPDGNFDVPRDPYYGYPIGTCPPQCVLNGGETVFLSQGLFAP
jgi:hypothetical protein